MQVKKRKKYDKEATLKAKIVNYVDEMEAVSDIHGFQEMLVVCSSNIRPIFREQIKKEKQRLSEIRSKR